MALWRTVVNDQGELDVRARALRTPMTNTSSPTRAITTEALSARPTLRAPGVSLKHPRRVVGRR